MKRNNLLIAAFVLAAFCSVKPALANMDAGEKAEFIATLRQASGELKNSNAQLSGKLNDYADKKEKWVDKKDEKWEDMRAEKLQDAAKLREASAALAPTRKDLADDLNAMAEKCEKKAQKKAEKHGDHNHND